MTFHTQSRKCLTTSTKHFYRHTNFFLQLHNFFTDGSFFSTDTKSIYRHKSLTSTNLLQTDNTLATNHILCLPQAIVIWKVLKCVFCRLHFQNDLFVALEPPSYPTLTVHHSHTVLFLPPSLQFSLIAIK